MLQNLLLAAAAIIGIQFIVIVFLLKLIGEMKAKSKKDRMHSNKLIASVVRIASSYKNDIDKYHETCSACYSQYRSITADIESIYDRLDYVEGLHSHMVNSMHKLLKQGRVIKVKYMNTMIPYNSFGQLSDQDRKELFGQ